MLRSVIRKASPAQASDEGGTMHQNHWFPVMGPADAMAVLRASNLDENREALAVICLDPDRYVRAILVIAGAPTDESWSGLDHVLRCALAGRARGVVFASLRPGSTTLPRRGDVEMWRSMGSALASGGVPLLDWLIVSGRRWRSLGGSESYDRSAVVS
jgi:DNA repair protein RadC